jgi:Domain of unknown function (DUF4114)
MSKRMKHWHVAGALIVLSSLSIESFAACTFGVSGEPSLQTNFNGLFGAANAPNAVTDCLADGTGANRDGVWTTQGSTSATILLEIAGFANLNTFGIYDPSNPTNQLQVFAGAEGPGSNATLSFTVGPGGVTVAVTTGGVVNATMTPFLSAAFGFYLTTPQGNTFFSQSNLNTGGVDRMYAYRGDGVPFIAGPGPVVGTIFGANDAILAYEDLLVSDNDFQDFVVLVRGVAPIPLPAAGLLLLSALGGFAAFRRRESRPSALAAV